MNVIYTYIHVSIFDADIGMKFTISKCSHLVGEEDQINYIEERDLPSLDVFGYTRGTRS